MKSRNLKIIVGMTIMLLLIPLVAMQFTDEVLWNVTDFVVAAILLFFLGFLIDFLIRNIHNKKTRFLIILLALLLFILVWIELAVGVF